MDSNIPVISSSCPASYRQKNKKKSHGIARFHGSFFILNRFFNERYLENQAALSTALFILLTRLARREILRDAFRL